MTVPIIAVCVLLILAYIFDITASKTKIPSVILLFALGWTVRQGTNFLGTSMPDLNEILPVLGTVGLILIVLEGSLELELNRSKFPFIGKMTLISMLPMLALSFGLAYAFRYFEGTSLRTGLTNAIPFAVISSAIAIPSAQNLNAKNKEFVTYESSLSDIFGVILFNFVTLNSAFTIRSFGGFFVDLFVILLISVVMTLGLAFLLSKIKHPVKFVPIILIIVLIYEVSKEYNLPALVFILLFGLALGNLDEIKKSRGIQRLKPSILDKEVHKLKELTTEISFLIRALFFLVFGFLLETKNLLNPTTMVWAAAITSTMYGLRFVFLKLFGMSLKPLLFVAPRGLITILLFLTIPVAQTIDVANKSLTIQVIILSALIMMFGLLFNKEPADEDIAVEPDGATRGNDLLPQEPARRRAIITRQEPPS